MLKLRVSFVAAMALACSISFADDKEKNWHQFRGPTGNGIAIDAKPPIKWTPDQAKWQSDVPGQGSSSPIVWGDKIILLTAVKTDRQQEGAEAKPDPAPQQQSQQRGGRRRGGFGFGGPPPANYYDFFVICFDRTNGQEVWKTKVNSAIPHEAGHGTNTFASGSPVTNGKLIWASFNSFGLFCLDMDGKIKWQRDFGKMKTRASFGEGASPTLHDNTLVLNWDHEGQSFIEAMNATTGEKIWRTERDEQTSWSTPVVVRRNGTTQVITNGAKRVRSYDLSNGKLIWECGGQTGNPIPTPIVVDDMVVCMTGFRANAAFGIPLDGKGDLTDSGKVIWSRRDIGPYVPTGVLYEGSIYSTKGSNAILTSIEAKTGKTIIDQSRLDGVKTIYASMVAANGHIYVTGRNGTTLVLKHGDNLDVVATNDLGEEVDATPAIVGNQIIIRGKNRLYCFENSD